MQIIDNKYTTVHPRRAQNIPQHGHPELRLEETVMNISIGVIPGDYMLMHSRMFVWENCIVVISVTPELWDATWQTSSTAPRCPPRIYIFITMQERKRRSITPAHSECPEPERFNWMYSNVIHWTITLSFCEPPAQSFCLCWGLLPFPCPLPNTPTPFKLEIGLAFVGDTKGESIDALITAIHYPNKHGTQPLLDTNSGYVKCLARDKALHAGINPCCINPRAQTPLSARAPPGSVLAGINPPCTGIDLWLQNTNMVMWQGANTTLLRWDSPFFSSTFLCWPTVQQANRAVSCSLATLHLQGLSHGRLQRLLKAPGRGRR